MRQSVLISIHSARSIAKAVTALQTVTTYTVKTRQKECSQNLRTAYLESIHHRQISEIACVP